MDPQRDFRKNYHTLRRLKHAEMERDKFMDVLQKDHEQLQKKLYRRQKQTLEMKLGEYKLTNGLNLLESTISGKVQAANADTPASTKRTGTKRKLRKRRKRKSRPSTAASSASIPAAGECLNADTQRAENHERKLSNGRQENGVDYNRGNRDEQNPLLNGDCFMSGLASLELDSGVSSNECEGEESDADEDVISIAEFTPAASEPPAHTEVHASVCSVFDSSDFNVDACKDSLESDSHTSHVSSRRSSSTSMKYNARAIATNNRPRSSPAVRLTGQSAGGITRQKPDKVVPVIDFYQTHLGTNNSLQVQGINIGQALRVRECWNGEPEAISSIRRPIPSREETRLKKMVNEFLDKKPLSIIQPTPRTPKQDKFVPPYPVYFKSASSSNGNLINVVNLLPPKPPDLTPKRPQSACFPFRVKASQLAETYGPLRRSPNLAPTRARPFSAPAKSSQSLGPPGSNLLSGQTTSQVPVQPHPPLKVELDIDNIRVRSKSAAVRPRASSAKLANRRTNARVKSGTEQARLACTCSGSPYYSGMLADRQEKHDGRYVKPVATPRALTPSDSEASEDETEPEYVMKVFVTAKQVESDD